MTEENNNNSNLTLKTEKITIEKEEENLDDKNSNIFLNKKRKNDNKEENEEEKEKEKDDNITKLNSNEENGEIINTEKEEENENYDNLENENEKILKPLMENSFVSFELFQKIISENLSSKRLRHLYEKYEKEYMNNIKNEFFEEHKNDEWFKEKFHPFYIPEIKKDLNEQCQRLNTKFQNELKEIENKIKLELIFDDLKNINIEFYQYSNDENKKNFTEKSMKDFTNTNINNEINKNFSNTPYYAFEKEKRRLNFFLISKNITRHEILNFTKETKGFEFISLSYPIRDKDFSRFCYLYYDNEENTKNALEKINTIIKEDENLNKIFPKITEESKIKIRVTPPLFDNRIEEDLDYSKQIIDIFDKEFNIENNSIFINENNRNKENQLDIQILYLRRVHGFCYYCLKKFDDEGNLSHYCDDIHLRNYKKIGKRIEINNKNDLLNEIIFDQFFTNKIQLYLKSINQKKILNIYERNIIPDNLINNMKELYFEDLIEIKNDCLYICKVCGKSFENKKYLRKHFDNSEFEILENNIRDEILENAEKENFLSYDRSNEFMGSIKIINSENDYNNKESIFYYRYKYNNNYIDFDDPDNFQQNKIDNFISYESL